ncbi:MAG TPA: hypothetical protein VFF73_08235 [Planctomycetota bacterium]|nr:hypothetical protein [Planctomycetota bacterium]
MPGPATDLGEHVGMLAAAGERGESFGATTGALEGLGVAEDGRSTFRLRLAREHAEVFVAHAVGTREESSRAKG